MPATIAAAVGRFVKSPRRTVPNHLTDVRTVQKLLNTTRTKIGVPARTIPETGAMGPETEAAIVEFQQTQFGAHDGVIEPGQRSLRTLNAIAGSSGFGALALQFALQEDGVRESPLGSNRGPRVDEYINSVGLEGAHLWCMAFVYWCFKKANAGHLIHKTASCSQLFAWAKTNQKLVTLPMTGDVFLVRGGAGGRTHQHTGIVVSVAGGNLSTIEGNTNDDGSSNGIGVFRRSRFSKNLDFVRI